MATRVEPWTVLKRVLQIYRERTAELLPLAAAISATAAVLGHRPLVEILVRGSSMTAAVTVSIAVGAVLRPFAALLPPVLYDALLDSSPATDGAPHPTPAPMPS